MSIAIEGIFRKTHNRRSPIIERHQKKTDSLERNRRPCLFILRGSGLLVLQLETVGEHDQYVMLSPEIWLKKSTMYHCRMTIHGSRLSKNFCSYNMEHLYTGFLESNKTKKSWKTYLCHTLIKWADIFTTGTGVDIAHIRKEMLLKLVLK